VQPATPTSFHTVQEPDASGRLPRRDFLDAAPAARQVAVEERPPPPVVVGGPQLIDGSVPRRYGPAEEPDADGWVLAAPGRAPAPEGLPPSGGESLPGPPVSGAGGGPRGHGARPAPEDVAGVAAVGLFRLAYRRGCAFTGRG
jgi:hypothetical protein